MVAPRGARGGWRAEGRSQHQEDLVRPYKLQVKSY